jgi:hypothetical protein
MISIRAVFAHTLWAKEVCMALMCSFVVAACLSAISLPVPSSQKVAEKLLFRTSLPAFVSTADSSKHDPRLDWSTDGCSAPFVESTGRSFNFYNACRRHDFGYRNMSRLNNGTIWSEALRQRIDEIFRMDMRSSCKPRGVISRAQCLAWAETYFRAVRSFGSP